MKWGAAINISNYFCHIPNKHVRYTRRIIEKVLACRILLNYTMKIYSIPNHKSFNFVCIHVQKCRSLKYISTSNCSLSKLYYLFSLHLDIELSIALKYSNSLLKPLLFGILLTFNYQSVNNIKAFNSLVKFTLKSRSGLESIIGYSIWQMLLRCC